jgi:hypothetical protein
MQRRSITLIANILYHFLSFVKTKKDKCVKMAEIELDGHRYNVDAKYLQGALAGLIDLGCEGIPVRNFSKSL